MHRISRRALAESGWHVSFFLPQRFEKWLSVGLPSFISVTGRKGLAFYSMQWWMPAHLDSCLSGVMPVRGLKAPCPKIPFFPEVLSQFQKCPLCACYPKGIIEWGHHFVGKGHYVSAGWCPGRNKRMWFKLLPPGIACRENGEMGVLVGKEVIKGVGLPESLRSPDLLGRTQWCS